MLHPPLHHTSTSTTAPLRIVIRRLVVNHSMPVGVVLARSIPRNGPLIQAQDWPVFWHVVKENENTLLLRCADRTRPSRVAASRGSIELYGPRGACAYMSSRLVIIVFTYSLRCDRRQIFRETSHLGKKCNLFSYFSDFTVSCFTSVDSLSMSISRLYWIGYGFLHRLGIFPRCEVNHQHLH